MRICMWNIGYQNDQSDSDESIKSQIIVDDIEYAKRFVTLNCDIDYLFGDNVFDEDIGM